MHTLCRQNQQSKYANCTKKIAIDNPNSPFDVYKWETVGSLRQGAVGCLFHLDKKPVKSQRAQRFIKT